MSIPPSFSRALIASLAELSVDHDVPPEDIVEAALDVRLSFGVNGLACPDAVVVKILRELLEMPSRDEAA